MASNFQWRYVDATETASGTVVAADVAHAAMLVLQEPEEFPRWKRHGIRERDIEAAPRDAEVAEFSRFNVCSLDVVRHGTRKRKPVQVSV